MMLTAKRVRELLNYDPVTGLFTFRVTRGSKKAGSIAGWLRPDGYVRLRIDGREYTAHQVAWLYTTGQWLIRSLDHKNNIRSDNRMCNLRRATQTQNQGNKKRPSNNKSGYKGVHWSKRRRKWVARIKVNRRPIDIGFFISPAMAHKAYKAAARKYFGAFARFA